VEAAAPRAGERAASARADVVDPARSGPAEVSCRRATRSPAPVAGAWTARYGSDAETPGAGAA